jgi:hypothetical protein
MRRLLLPLALFALTGTLVAQTPTIQSGMPLTMPDRLHSKVYWSSGTRDGRTMRLKDARIVFENGVTITADDAVVQADEDTIQLVGNVKMKLK